MGHPQAALAAVYLVFSVPLYDCIGALCKSCNIHLTEGYPLYRSFGELNSSFRSRTYDIYLKVGSCEVNYDYLCPETYRQYGRSFMRP